MPFPWLKSPYQYNNMSDFKNMTVEQIIHLDPASVNPNLTEKDSDNLSPLQKKGIELVLRLKTNETKITHKTTINNGRNLAINNFLNDNGLKTNRELDTIIKSAADDLVKENTEGIKYTDRVRTIEERLKALNNDKSYNTSDTTAQEAIERRLANLLKGGKQTKKRKQRKTTKQRKIKRKKTTKLKRASTVF